MGVEEVIPAPEITINTIDTTGIEMRLDTIAEFLEDWRETTMHPALTTNFADYTVVEALLLLLFVSMVVKSCIAMIKRGFSWLL